MRRRRHEAVPPDRLTWLATAGDTRRCALFALFSKRRGAQWPALAAAIQDAMRNAGAEG